MKPGQAWRVNPGPGLEPGRVEEKTGKKTWCDLVDPATRSKTLLTFVFFFTKITLFWFKKKELTRATRSKPGTRVLDRARSKYYGLNNNEWNVLNQLFFKRILSLHNWEDGATKKKKWLRRNMIQEYTSKSLIKRALMWI